ncbi:unnamed protein product [Phytophthora lilii]|uniref:Unnamed protein product n=1 Tax=Phytophthora lilii TaxID=2077276 RepID=A0A9W6YIW3_9STRA|nr:unnamed protein product [Phytophthora lilii]
MRVIFSLFVSVATIVCGINVASSEAPVLANHPSDCGNSTVGTCTNTNRGLRNIKGPDTDKTGIVVEERAAIKSANRVVSKLAEVVQKPFAAAKSVQSLKMKNKVMPNAIGNADLASVIS